MSALLRYKLPLRTSPLPCVTAKFQGAGAKFKHILSPGSHQFVKKPPTSLRGHFNIAPRGETFHKSVALWTSSQRSGCSIYRGRRGTPGKVAVGLAAGVSTSVLVQSLHTGSFTAMALKVNLNSNEGDWKEIKGEACQQKSKRMFRSMLSCSLHVIREIHVWNHMTETPANPDHSIAFTES